MELAIQIISNDKTVRSDTVQDIKEFTNQSFATQAKKGEQLLSMMSAFKKALNLMGDDIVELSTKTDAIKKEVGSYDPQWLEESKAMRLKRTDDDERSNLFTSRKKNRWENIK